MRTKFSGKATLTYLIQSPGPKTRDYDGFIRRFGFDRKFFSAFAGRSIIFGFDGTIRDSVAGDDADPIRTIQPPTDLQGVLFHRIDVHGLQFSDHFIMQNRAGGPNHAGGLVVPRIGRHGELVNVVGGQSDIGHASVAGDFLPIQITSALRRVITYFIGKTFPISKKFARSVHTHTHT